MSIASLAAVSTATFCVATLYIAPTAFAQSPATTPPPATPPSVPPSQDPSLTSPTIDQDLLDQKRERPAPAPVEPDASPAGQRMIPSVPGVDRLSFALPNRKFRTEGAFATQLKGGVTRLPGGEHVFIADAPLDGTPGDQPMLLLPSQKLAQLEAITKGNQSTILVTISGQAFVYRGRQYLLPNTFSLVSKQRTQTVSTPANSPANTPANTPAAPTNSTTSTPQTTSSTAPISTSSTDRDPRVDDIVRELEVRGRGQRLLAPAPSIAADTTPVADEAQPNLLPEGELVMNRRGRLVRLSGSDGRFALVLDNDPNSPSSGPFVVLPCRVLETMEGLAAGRGDEASFRISGRILVHNGRNYILPTLAQMERASELMPMQ